jgi:hypothetical protein
VQVSRNFRPASAVFDEDHLVSCAGLVPVTTLATQTAPPDLLAETVHIDEPKIESGSANPTPRLATLIAAMCAGADCIENVDIVRWGWDDDPVRWCVRTVYGGNVVAGVHLRPCPPVGVGTA